MASLASRTISPSFDRPIFDRALLETLPVAVYVCDKDGRLLYFNRRAIELWGCEPELNSFAQRYCGSHEIALSDGTHVLHAGCPMTEALRSGKPVDGLEAVIERPNGDRVSCLVNIGVLRNASGKITGAVNCLQDISESKRAAEQLRQSQKMETVGQLTGGVAHDFNNLLTAIIGNLEMLGTIQPAQERARRYTEAALRAAERGAQLTERMLAFSRRQETRPEIVNINRLLHDIVMLCQRIVGDDLEIALHLQDDLWTCNVDAAQFEAAVLNLSANARDAMNRSGRLTFATENVTVGATDGIDLLGGEYVVFSVADSGCGMSASVRARAFEPFFTTKEVGRGTGLGLSQVYGFAKQSGGTARIESRTGQGTTVRVYLPRRDGLPRIDGQIADTMSSRDRPSRQPVGTATVLVVEDDLDVRELVVGMLPLLGYRILVATTGPEALAILRRDRSVDLLFSDVAMPEGMSGIELARAACRLRPGLRVLLSSGHVDDSQSEAIRAEFPFIAKPYRPLTLGSKLEEVLADQVPERIS